MLSDENEINSSKITTLIGPKLSSMWCKERKKKKTNWKFNYFNHHLKFVTEHLCHFSCYTQLARAAYRSGTELCRGQGASWNFFLSRIHGRIFSYSNASQWQINEINIWLYFSKDMFHNTVHASRMMHVKWYFWWCLVWLINGAEWKQNMFSVFKKLLWK